MSGLELLALFGWFFCIYLSCQVSDLKIRIQRLEKKANEVAA